MLRELNSIEVWQAVNGFKLDEGERGSGERVGSRGRRAPQKIRTRKRARTLLSRFVQPQDVIASHVKSEYRDKLKEALGTSSATATTTTIGAQQQQKEKEAAQKTDQGGDRSSSNNNYKNNNARRVSAQALSGATAPTAAPADSTVNRPFNHAVDTVRSPMTATAAAVKVANEDWGVRRRRGGVAKVVQMTASSAVAAAV